MSGIERLSATPCGVRLCALSDIPDRSARNFVLQLKSGRFHGFVVRFGMEVYGYVDRCPHMGIPLAKSLDQYMTPDGDHIKCGWHGALFRVEDGSCVEGPCLGGKLAAWPLATVMGDVFTA